MPQWEGERGALGEGDGDVALAAQLLWPEIDAFEKMIYYRTGFGKYE